MSAFVTPEMVKGVIKVKGYTVGYGSSMIAILLVAIILPLIGVVERWSDTGDFPTREALIAAGGAALLGVLRAVLYYVKSKDPKIEPEIQGTITQ